MPIFQAVRQLFIQSPAKASFSCIVIEINGQLARPVVCGAADKGMCVCITFDFSILLDDEVWIFFMISRMRFSNSSRDGTSHSKEMTVYST